MSRENRPSVIVFNNNRPVRSNNSLNRPSVIVFNVESDDDDVNIIEDNIVDNRDVILERDDSVNNELEVGDVIDELVRDVDIVNNDFDVENVVDDLLEEVDNVNDELEVGDIVDELVRDVDIVNNDFDVENIVDGIVQEVENINVDIDDDNAALEVELANAHELNPEQYLNLIRSHYQLLPVTTQRSREFGVLYSHFKTVINSNIYRIILVNNFLDLFRDIFQDVFNRVLELIERDYPGVFGRVKVALHNADFNVNLQFVTFSELCSELFLIELYRLLQSKREVITSSTLNLSFTFLPKSRSER